MLKKHGEREHEIIGRKAAMAAARLMIEKGKSQGEAAQEAHSNRSSVSSALAILNFGTEQEIAGVENGTLPLEPTAESIRRRTTPEERKTKRVRSVLSKEALAARQFDAEIWQGLRSALDAITGLPNPKDTVHIVRKNQMRVEHVNRKLLVALQWIQEFSNEITG